MISSLSTYSVFISLSSEKEENMYQKRAIRCLEQKKCVLIVFSMLNDKSHLFAGHKHGCYYLMAGKKLNRAQYVVYVPFPIIKKKCSSHKNPTNKLPYFSATV